MFPPENFKSLGFKWWHLMHFQEKFKSSRNRCGKAQTKGGKGREVMEGRGRTKRREGRGTGNDKVVGTRKRKSSRKGKEVA